MLRSTKEEEKLQDRGRSPLSSTHHWELLIATTVKTSVRFYIFSYHSGPPCHSPACVLLRGKWYAGNAHQEMSSLPGYGQSLSTAHCRTVSSVSSEKCTENISSVCHELKKGTASEFSLCAFSKPTCNQGVSGWTRRLKLPGPTTVTAGTFCSEAKQRQASYC